MEQQRIGKLAEADANRDAIHVAIAPVVAHCRLSPGQHVGLRPDGKAESMAANIGVVDPFLEGAVMPGERFFLCLYPGTITSLRHDWTHPRFEAVANMPIGREAYDSVADSRRWLTDYAVANCPYDETPEVAYKNFMEGVNRGEVFYHGCDLHSQSDLVDADGLFHHLSIVLGRKVSPTEFGYSCSC